MISELKIVQDSPMLIRVVPFVAFLILTMGQGKFGETSPYWFYLVKTLAGAGLIWWMRPFVREMRWKVDWEAVGVGIAVFAVWVGLDPLYPKMGSSTTTWNPFTAFPDSPALAWLFVSCRILGSTLIVPGLEEVFYRSFVYRYIENQNFESVPFNRFQKFPFILTALIFGFAHNEWLAGILCGFAYQWLMIRKNGIGHAMTAHAVTNLLLGIWVVWKQQWNFW